MRLKRAREAAGLSQRDLSFPGCTPAYVSRIEKGDRIPSAQILREFARRLGVSEGYLANGQEDTVPRSLFAEARVAMRVGDTESARNLIDAGLARASSDHERGTATALYGELALQNSDAARAVEDLERAQRLYPALATEDPEFVETLGRAYARTNDYESAIATFLKAYERAKEADDSIRVVRFGTLLANAYSDSGNFAAAEAVLGETIAAAASAAEPLGRARIYWTQSRMHALRHDTENAARYAQRALEVLRFSDDAFYLGRAHQLLAHIEIDRGNSDRALQLLDQAQPYIQASGRPYESASVQLERARALMKVGKKKQAASLAMSTAAVLEGASPLDAGRGYAIIAEVFEDLGDRERAMELYELAIERLEGVPTRYLVEAYSKLAELLERSGEPGRALSLLRRAMKIQSATGRPV